MLPGSVDSDERAGAGGVAPVPGEDGGPEGAVYSAGAAHKSPEVAARPGCGALCGGRGPVHVLLETGLRALLREPRPA